MNGADEGLAQGPDEIIARQTRDAADRARRAGTVLRSLPRGRIADALTGAAARLADSDRTDVRTELVRSSRLSAPMVDWALNETLAPVSVDALLECTPERSSGYVKPAGLTAIVLAGNVFTAPFSPVVLALLSRSPVILKASTRDDAFPRLFAAALREADEAVGACVETVTFKGGLESAEQSLFAQADCVIAYGSDHTLREIRHRIPSTSVFVGRGHGLGVAYVPPNAGDMDSLAARLALDVAAYDQRGCLSPHAVFVAAGSGKELAPQLAEALRKLERELPRGPLPTQTGAQQLQWRAVGAMRGDLHEGDGYAVAYEGSGPFRISPGYRNVAVIDVDGDDAFLERIASLGSHLKCLGVAGDLETRQRIAKSPAPGLFPRVCPVGSMQKPRLGEPADGVSSTAGMLRPLSVT